MRCRWKQIPKMEVFFFKRAHFDDTLGHLSKSLTLTTDSPLKNFNYFKYPAGDKLETINENNIFKTREFFAFKIKLNHPSRRGE